MNEAEWKSYGRELEKFDELFMTIWDVGQPVWSDRIETAAVEFDPVGRHVQLLICRGWWQGLPRYDQLFVLAHELLHVGLNHGVRTLDLPLKSFANVAADLAVNHLLVAQFGFDRALIQLAPKLIWEETVFGSRLVPDCLRSLEDYYRRLLAASRVERVPTLDTHLFEGFRGIEVEKQVAAWVAEQVGPEKWRWAAKLKHEGQGSHLAGDVPLGQEEEIPRVKPYGHVDWRRWLRTRLCRLADGEAEGWEWPHRRFPGELVPGARPRPRPGRQEVVFFVDTSGSVWNERAALLAMAETLPPDQFEVEGYSFDTQVYATAPRRARGGGGTSFGVLEEFLANRKRYPQAVVVLTDGMGDEVRPRHPERWHWLLTEGGTEHYIPKRSAWARIQPARADRIPQSGPRSGPPL